MRAFRVGSPHGQGGEEALLIEDAAGRGRLGPSGLLAPQGFSELALEDDRDRALAEVDGQLLVALPEGAFELVGAEHEAALSRADVEEECLHR